MPDLSVLIPSRNEMWLGRTIDSVLARARADTEVIAVLDGEWPKEPLPDHPKLRVTHSASVIGQRGGTNLAARMSTATYVMKLDAHCDLDDGFDVKLIEADREIGRPDLTQIPAMLNLHAFNWKCLGCGTETYQGPTPTMCSTCSSKGTSGGPFERVVYWDLQANGLPGRKMRSEFWRFDHELHFQYWHDFKHRPEAKGELVDVMSSIGACFFMRRDRFHEIGGLDEGHGSWGQYGTEIACKSWLSGGRQIVNKRTWFAHLFRTQGGDFGFPYAQPGSAVDAARRYSRKLWIDGTWSGAKLPLSWMLEKFGPVPDWTQERIDALGTGKYAVPVAVRHVPAKPSVGLAYYTDCRGDKTILDAVRAQIKKGANGHQIVSATLKPVSLGTNIVPLVCRGCGATRFYQKGRADRCDVCGAVDGKAFDALERGYLTMFRQQLAALEALDTDIAFMVEHDVLYSPTHFEFVPPKREVFYYNQNTWRVDPKTGQALFYLCSQVSGLCAYRDILVDHYRKRVAHVEAHGFNRDLGFEPGTNRRARALDGRSSETWMSAVANVDIKTEFCLTPGRWSRDKFRNQNSCLGWQESDAVPGWGTTKGRFAEFLAEVRA